MKIMFAIHALSGGGAERQMSYLSEYLASHNYNLIVVYRDEGPLGDDALLENVKYYKLKTKGNYNLSIIPELYRLIKREKPNVIQSWINQFDVLIGIIRILCRFKWVSREANSGTNHKGFRNKWLRERLLSRVDHVVANSPQGYEYWKDKTNASLILNGFKLTAEPMPSEEDTTTASHGNNYILYVGRLVKHKNVDKLIECFAETHMQDSHRLVICGEGSMKEELVELIANLNLADKVDMPGFLPASDIKRLMHGARLLCLLSDYEGMPNVVFEAMMLKTPVLLSSSKSHTALFDEESVTFVDMNNTDDLTQTLDTLVSQDHDSAKTESAYRFVANCSVDKMSNSYIQLYESLIMSAQ